MMQGKSKVSFSDLMQMPVSEIKKKYKLTEKTFEPEVRKHMDGMTNSRPEEIKQFYDKIYDKV